MPPLHRLPGHHRLTPAPLPAPPPPGHHLVLPAPSAPALLLPAVPHGRSRPRVQPASLPQHRATAGGWQAGRDRGRPGPAKGVGGLGEGQRQVRWRWVGERGGAGEGQSCLPAGVGDCWSPAGVGDCWSPAGVSDCWSPAGVGDCCCSVSAYHTTWAPSPAPAPLPPSTSTSHLRTPLCPPPPTLPRFLV